MRDWFSLRPLLVGGLVVGIALLALPVAAGVGDPVLAGRTNQVDEQTRIKGDVGTPNLKLTNTNPAGLAASFNVEPGNPPFKVSSGERVKLLNADRVDGKHIGAILTKAEYDDDKNGVVDDSEAVGGLTVDEIVSLAALPPADRLVFGTATSPSVNSVIPAGTVLTSITFTSMSGIQCRVALRLDGATMLELLLEIPERYIYVPFETGIPSDGTLAVEWNTGPGCDKTWATWTGYIGP